MFGLSTLFQAIAGLATEIHRMRDIFRTANDQLDARFKIEEPTLTLSFDASATLPLSDETKTAKTKKR